MRIINISSPSLPTTFCVTPTVGGTETVVGIVGAIGLNSCNNDTIERSDTEFSEDSSDVNRCANAFVTTTTFKIDVNVHLSCGEDVSVSSGDSLLQFGNSLVISFLSGRHESLNVVSSFDSVTQSDGDLFGITIVSEVNSLVIQLIEDSVATFDLYAGDVCIGTIVNEVEVIPDSPQLFGLIVLHTDGDVAVSSKFEEDRSNGILTCEEPVGGVAHLKDTLVAVLSAIGQSAVLNLRELGLELVSIEHGELGEGTVGVVAIESVSGEAIDTLRSISNGLLQLEGAVPALCNFVFICTAAEVLVACRHGPSSSVAVVAVEAGSLDEEGSVHRILFGGSSQRSHSSRNDTPLSSLSSTVFDHSDNCRAFLRSEEQIGVGHHAVDTFADGLNRECDSAGDVAVNKDGVLGVDVTPAYPVAFTTVVLLRFDVEAAILELMQRQVLAEGNQRSLGVPVVGTEEELTSLAVLEDIVAVTQFLGQQSHDSRCIEVSNLTDSVTVAIIHGRPSIDDMVIGNTSTIVVHHPTFAEAEVEGIVSITGFGDFNNLRLIGKDEVTVVISIILIDTEELLGTDAVEIVVSGRLEDSELLLLLVREIRTVGDNSLIGDTPIVGTYTIEDISLAIAQACDVSHSNRSCSGSSLGCCQDSQSLGGIEVTNTLDLNNVTIIGVSPAVDNISVRSATIDVQRVGTERKVITTGRPLGDSEGLGIVVGQRQSATVNFLHELLVCYTVEISLLVIGDNSKLRTFTCLIDVIGVGFAVGDSNTSATDREDTALSLEDISTEVVGEDFVAQVDAVEEEVRHVSLAGILCGVTEGECAVSIFGEDDADLLGLPLTNGIFGGLCEVLSTILCDETNQVLSKSGGAASVIDINGQVVLTSLEEDILLVLSGSRPDGQDTQHLGSKAIGVGSRSVETSGAQEGGGRTSVEDTSCTSVAVGSGSPATNGLHTTHLETFAVSSISHDTSRNGRCILKTNRNGTNGIGVEACIDHIASGGAIDFCTIGINRELRVLEGDTFIIAIDVAEIFSSLHGESSNSSLGLEGSATKGESSNTVRTVSLLVNREGRIRVVSH